MSRSFTGSKGSVKINGVKVAMVGSISISEDNTLTDIDVLDQLEVAELAETAHKVSGSFNKFKVSNNNMSDYGLSPANIRDILTQPESVLEIYNSTEDKVEYTVTGMKLENLSGSVDARGVWQGVASFKGRIGRGM